MLCGRPYIGCIAEMSPKRDFSTWDYQTQRACSAEETEAIQQYEVAIQRRAYEIVCELQDQRDATGASRAQTEARAERKRAQAKESHSPPFSQTHLMQKSSSKNAARSLQHQPEQQTTYSCPSTWTPDRTEQEGRFNFEGEEEEEERVCFWEEVGDDEQWWNNMVIAELVVVEKQQQGSQPAAWLDEDDEQLWNNIVLAELGVVEKQPQESQPAAWLDEDDDTGGEQPISSPPRQALSGIHPTFSCRADIKGTHRRAGDARRGRIFQTVAQEGGDRGKRREKDWKSLRLSGGLGFGFFAGPGEEHGRRRRCCPLRERVREKEKMSSGARARVQKGTYIAYIYFLVLQIRGLVRFLVWY